MKKLTREMVYKVPQMYYQEPGYYIFDDILADLEETYPEVPIYRNVVAKILLSMGYGRVRIIPDTLQRAKRYQRGQTCFCIRLHRRRRQPLFSTCEQLHGG